MGNLRSLLALHLQYFSQYMNENGRRQYNGLVNKDGSGLVLVGTDDLYKLPHKLLLGFSIPAHYFCN